MSAHNLYMQVPLVALLIAAAVSDVRRRRIPNWLTMTMLGAGLLLSWTPLRLVTPTDALLGALVGFALPLVLYMLGGLAAGDVKLLCGIGAWVGPWMALLVIAAAALVGLVLVLGQCLLQGRLRVLMRNSGMLILSLINLPRLGMKQVIETGQSCQSAKRPMPYAVPVLVGTVGLMVAAIVRGQGGVP